MHDMPLLCMAKGVGTKIGNSLGNLHDVDVVGDGVGWGRCQRICVTIDLTNPLERGRALHFARKSHWISFNFEKLPMLCFHCGRIVHGRQGCPERLSGRLNSGITEKQWGLWLRADDPKRRGLGKNGATGWKGTSREQQANAGAYSFEGSPRKESFGSFGNPRGDNQYCAAGEDDRGDSDEILGGNIVGGDAAKSFSGHTAESLGRRDSVQSQTSRHVAPVEDSNVHGKFINYGKLKPRKENDQARADSAMFA